METTEDFICTLVNTIHFIEHKADKISCALEKMNRYQLEIRQDERRKIALEVKSLKYSDIIISETVYNAILSGGK